ncbi:tyrosine-type recombinase/integrase [Pseudomonas putida]|uniref:tyrosine-type recombinase/integrase n=1 Tax=Pseudomonas putida TaxID=303 RepID=UPI003D9699F1
MSLADAFERRFCHETQPNAERDEVVRSTCYSRMVARRNRAILLIGFWFGLTTAEVCKLRWNEVTMADGFLKIATYRFDANRRNRKYYFQLGRLPLLCPLAALEDWLAYAGGSNNYVFPCSIPKALPCPVSSRVVQDNFNKLIKNNNGAVFSMRSLRYSLYFFLADNGWSRQKILRYVPFYKMEASKTRLLRTRRDITTDRTSSTTRAEDILNIISAIENSSNQTD